MTANRHTRSGLCRALAMVALSAACPALSMAQTSADKAAASSATQTTARHAEGSARQSQLAADSDRLYKMAQELKAEVAKSNKDILSVTVVKKADDIEKLAKSLKERLKAD